jgi:hypothetical protein
VTYTVAWRGVAAWLRVGTRDGGVHTTARLSGCVRPTYAVAPAGRLANRY